MIRQPIPPAIADQLLSAAPFCVFWKDTDSRYMGCNEAFAQLAGLSSPEAVQGKSDDDMPWRAQADQFRAEDREILQTGKAISVTKQLPWRSSSGQFVQAHKQPLRGPDGAVIGIMGHLENITLLHQTEASWMKLDRANRLLMRCNQHIVAARDEQKLLQDICTFILEGGYVMAWIGRIESESGKRVIPVAEAGMVSGYLDGIVITWDEAPSGRGPTGTAVREARPVVNQNFLTNPNMTPWREAALKRGFQSSIALPVIKDQAVLCVITIYATEADAFDAGEVALLESLASNIAVGIEALRDHQKRVSVLEQSVGAIAATIELRDPYTAGHERHVMNLSIAIARRLGLGEEEISGLRVAALLHDIGKIRVPIEILTSPRMLTEPEMAIIRTHPDVGYDIIRNIPFSRPVAQIVRQHHERLDGSGYPQGLRGDQILIEARILAVADVFESMASNRPYRPSLGDAAALQELQNGRGTLYDAAAVDACTEVIRSGAFRWEG